MDCPTSLSKEARANPITQTDEMTHLFACGVVLPTDEYRTTLTQFPDANCNARWGLTGKFMMTLNIYNAGKKIGEVATKLCTEKDYFYADLDDFSAFLPDPIAGLVIAEVDISPNIPLETYLTYTNRRTGTIVSYPVLAFVGDIIYPEVHKTQLENALFWSGIANTSCSRSEVMVMNPFQESQLYQFVLYGEDGGQLVSKTFKAQALQVHQHVLEDIFPEILPGSGNERRYSLCITSQFKSVALYALRDRKSGVYSMIDHLNTFTLE